MADHLRTQIRDAAVTLITGLTTTGSKVYNARIKALAEGSNLPCWIVYVRNEEHTEDARTTDGVIQRNAELVFEGYCRQTNGGNAQDRLDLMLKELEIQFDTDRKLGGLLKDSRLVTVEIDDGDDDQGSQAIAGIQVVYLVTYWTTRGAPDVAL